MSSSIIVYRPIINLFQDIEYALHFLPVLAALMLSGHVRRGDAIDLPIPRPDAWPAVVSYIYTGKGEISSAMRDNILYLAGNAE